MVEKRAKVIATLKLLAMVLESNTNDYLTVYNAWKYAEAAVTEFLDNPDWLEEWVNDKTDATVDVEDRSA